MVPGQIRWSGQVKPPAQVNLDFALAVAAVYIISIVSRSSRHSLCSRRLVLGNDLDDLHQLIELWASLL